MSSQDSGYSSCEIVFESESSSSESPSPSSTPPPPSLDDYNAKVEQDLEAFERAAKLERYHLLETQFPLGTYALLCGISPARTFSPAITLKPLLRPGRISFGAFEWKSFVTLLRQKYDDFFHENLPTYPDEYDPIVFQCEDFCKVTQLVYDDTKFLLVHKHGVEFYLEETDVFDIINADNKMVNNYISMLFELNFCAFYYNLMDSIKCFFATNLNNDICNTNRESVLNLILENMPNDLLKNAFTQFMYHFKDRVTNDLYDFSIH